MLTTILTVIVHLKDCWTSRGALYAKQVAMSWKWCTRLPLLQIASRNWYMSKVLSVTCMFVCNRSSPWIQHIILYGSWWIQNERTRKIWRSLPWLVSCVIYLH